jgi:hypothetical protein
MFATFEDIGFDDEGEIDGYQFDGRERRMQDWRESKEDAEFDKLVARLRQKKNYRAWYDRHKNNPEFMARLRSHNTRMRAKHGQRRNAEARRQRAEAAEENPVVNVCQCCGKRFVRQFGFKRKLTAKFCTRTCRNKVAHEHRKLRRAAAK